MRSRVMWEIYRYIYRCQNTIHRMLGYPRNGQLEALEDLLTALVILAPLLVTGTIIWVLYKWITIRLGKDVLTNYRHYQKTFIDNFTDTPYRIADNISKCPHYLDDRKRLVHRYLKILFAISAIIASIIFSVIPIAYNISDLLYILYHQLREHRYTYHAFFTLVFQDIWKIISPIIIPLAIFIIVFILGKGINALHWKANLLFKTGTKITTKIHRVKKAHYEKSDI